MIGSLFFVEVNFLMVLEILVLLSDDYDLLVCSKGKVIVRWNFSVAVFVEGGFYLLI